ncbi:MAG: hypothetical protein ABH877_04165 [bacterium]
MGRVRANLNVNGRDRWTLFDTGARNTYVVADAAEGLISWEDDPPEPARLGGKVHEITRWCTLRGTIEGLRVVTHARVIDELGPDEEGKRIEILLGALAMQEWGIRPVPDEERLDLTHYPREFVEFTETCRRQGRRPRWVQEEKPRDVAPGR